MKLTLTVKNPELLSKNQSTQFSFSEKGGSIGRNPLNDWIICDVNRFISGKHALIRCQNGEFTITDTSTNGVFINQGTQALGNGNSTIINNNDQIQLGELNIVAQVEHGERPQTAETPLLQQTDDHDILANLFGDLGAPDSQQVLEPITSDANIEELIGASSLDDLHLDEGGVIDPLAILDGPADDDAFGILNSKPHERQSHSSFIDNATPLDMPFTPPKTLDAPGSANKAEEADELALLLKELEAPASPMIQGPAALDEEDDILSLLGIAPAKPVQAAKVQATPPVQSQAPKPVVPQKTADASTIQSADAILKAAGLEPSVYTTSQKQEILPLLGTMLRSCMDGLVTALMARNQVKSGLRMEVTTIAPVENNPLKFSVSGDEALRNLLSSRQGYLGPSDAIREGFQDLQIHQLAMMAATQKTLQSLVQRFNPNILERQFDQHKSNGIKLGSKKSQYWDQYEQFYQQMENAIGDDFMHLLGEVFANAYEEQTHRAKMKR
ncbi:MAG: type VI secretion system-associated FHA domain protein TagH [Gammaproteobacteria bacterium]|nr:type VI secretion system-associated FHA domain protein TagH [Gammaproteobacteria bacterium]